MNGMTPEERIKRARIAQVQWAKEGLASRCDVLRKLRRSIAEQREQIVARICEDTGKPPLDALAGDVLVTLEQIRFYESHAPHILRTRRVGKPSLLYLGARFYEQFEPHGVVLIYAPSNYPFQLAVVPMVTALFAGNGVILKCSEKTPRVAGCVEALCKDAGLPEDLVQVVDDAPELAAAFIDAGPDLIFFTGSTENGRSVARRAADHLIPAVLELGGKDAALVFADCPLERTLEGVTYGAFSHAGQVCVGIKRLFVEQSVYGQFLARLTSRVEALRIGSDPDSDLGRLQDLAGRARLVAQVEDALQRGARLHVPQKNAPSWDVPIVLSDVAPDARLLAEETFGPVLCVAPFATEAEAIALANSSAFALGASVWTRDRSRARRVAAALNAGSCAVNDVIRNIANPQASFGGNRASGYGRYHGEHGLYTFSRIKSVMFCTGRMPREINWFPFARKTLDWLNTFVGIRHSAKGLWSAVRRLLLVACMFSLLPSALASQMRNGHIRNRVAVLRNSHGSL
jgi:acyl-CoA reductase-like NAD-dependent aldehyde dehydrogenase